MLTSSARTLFFSLSTLSLLAGCPKPPGGGGGTPGKRCEVDLQASGLFKYDGSGARAQVLDANGPFIGGQTATARPGDVLLQNDRIRVVVEQPGRTVGPVLYGGGIVDADVVRPAGEAGHDQFGRMGLSYSFGRVTKTTDVTVLADGSAGGPAVVAVDGDDAQHDLLNLKSLVQAQLGNVQFVLDPDKALPLRVTTYYVLSPGESRVRLLTAFCNDSETEVAQLPLIELMDFRGETENFNPDSCENAMGMGQCFVDTSRWSGSQGDGVAYGLRSYALADAKVPVTANATLGYGGVVGSVIEGKDLDGVLTWTNADARSRPGTFSVRPKDARRYLRDFIVARDLAGVSAALLDADGVATGTVEVTAQLFDGAPAALGRVSVVDVASDRMVTLIEADAAGKGAARLAPGTYRLSAATPGRLPGAAVDVTVAAGGTHSVTLRTLDSRTLTVKVADAVGAAMPAKVTVYCAGGTCPFTNADWKRHLLLETRPGGAAAIGFVPVTGQVSLTVPTGEYDVVVSRGPEYSTWPDTWPASAHRVDLRTADAIVDAVLGRIVDSSGWMSADLHVHAINSTDSQVPNEVRVATFLAEGVDLLISTDHEVITDYAPVVESLGASSVMATMIGEEVTSFSHGHFNTMALTRDPSLPNGGAFDHAGGDGPSLSPRQLFPALKAHFPGALVQINHPRGGGGALTQLKVDTATLKSHANPADFLMAPAPDATADDTKLFGDGFDALEVANGSSPEFDVVNDWMTFLSRGTVRTATGVSDTHKAYSSVGGYSRTWARSGQDTPAQFTVSGFAEAVRANRAVIGNGPFMRVTARKVDGAGLPVGNAVEVGDTLSIVPGNNEGVELTVDVQAQDWVHLDRIELYTHTTGREAVNGEDNKTWPESRILDKKVLDPLALTVEPVPGAANLRRLRISETFIQRPAKDTWYVVLARSVTAPRTLAPLTGSRPWAMSNAILIDADGSGAYDDFPLKAGQPLSVRPKAPSAMGPRRVPTAVELEDALKRLLHVGEHEE